MTLGFALFAIGMALVASALKDKSVADILRGAIGEDVPFGTPKDYSAPSSGKGGTATYDILTGAADLPVRIAKGALEIIGTPFAGTHQLGNWQSDRAVDIALPEGTPIYSPTGGKVNKVRIKPSGGDRFAGSQVTVGGEEFFAHLSRVVVRAGQVIQPGQLVGYSGSANGVEHLHWGRRTKGLPG